VRAEVGSCSSWPGVNDDIVRTAMDEFGDTVNEILDRFEAQSSCGPPWPSAPS
jgi:bacterioferritin-associated ferredoxin